MSSATRRLGTTVSVIALLAAGAVIVGTAPTDDEVTAPFEVTGSIGDTVVGREATVLVTGIRATKHLTADYAFTPLDATTTGTWIVVDTVLTPESGNVGLNNSALRVGDYTFRASEVQPSPSLQLFLFGPDLPVTGSLIFEVPDFALELPAASDASVIFQSRIESTLDGVPVVRFDLADAESVETIDLPSARVEDFE